LTQVRHAINEWHALTATFAPRGTAPVQRTEMKYRHTFHAGNLGDVLKHTALVWLLRALVRKDKPIFFLDTHAGRGRYSLASQAALKSGEAREGAGRLLAGQPKSEALRAYLDLLTDFDPRAAAGHALATYPGSGLIAQRLLRPGDRAVLCEIQEHEAAALGEAIGRDARIRVERRDGYAALKALLPPAERRGLVLIDPAYELQQSETTHVVTALEEALRRWRTGVYSIWYPIKLRAHVEQLHRAVIDLEPPPTLAAELCIYRDDSRAGLNGAGVLILNPPWQAEEALGEAIAELHALLARDARSPHGVRWLVRE
jgi:23S rRNA (adenine2030-N6)-methyltransferase